MEWSKENVTGEISMKLKRRNITLCAENVLNFFVESFEVKK